VTSTSSPRSPVRPSTQRLARPDWHRHGKLLTAHLDKILAFVVLLVLWQIVTSLLLSGRHVVPSPTSVLSTMVSDRFYLPNLETTLWEALRGWLIGNLAAMALAFVALFVPRLSRLFQQFGAITYCLPTAAVGPLILIFASADTAKVIISALAVFFVSLIAWMTGLRACDEASLDLVRAYGGTRLTEIVRVRLRSALPSASGGLALSAPAAILGAIVGEYLGGSSGLGVAMASAEQNFQVDRTWAIGVLATVVSGLAYVLLVLIIRRLGGDLQIGTSGRAIPATEPTSGRFAVARSLLGSIASLVLIIGLWEFLLKVLGLSPYLAKSPAAVWSYLFSGSGSAANRAQIFAALGVTLRDAALGWLVGTVAALLGAAGLTALPRLRSAIFPLIMVLRSVPIVAMTPLIALVFGQGVVGVSAIAAIITFVPSLVLTLSGLDSVPPQAIELARAYDQSSLGILVKVRAPYALPSLFAAAKLSMPGAIIGAVLAEWLITGNGIGYLIATALIGSAFATLWSAVVVITAVSLVLYEAVAVLEKMADRRLSN
jgi:sulfonate transport system permease protein